MSDFAYNADRPTWPVQASSESNSGQLPTNNYIMSHFVEQNVSVDSLVEWKEGDPDNP
jgi:hypothetical protein